MADDPDLVDELRSEYDLARLNDGVRGKYWRRYQEKGNRLLLQTAIVCGVIPLTIGSAIYFGFRITRLDWLAIAGYFTILAGLGFFAVGITCLVAYAYRQDGLDGRTVLVGLLLLSNFPAAAFYALSAIALITQYTVQVVNESGAKIDSFVVEGPGVRVELGPIQVGEIKRTRVFFDDDGTATFTARQQQTRFDGEIDDYVSRNMGGEAIVQIEPGGNFVVLHPDRKSNDN
ncbi:MAG TPA: hypothetical protein VGK58_14575 [Lacipirellulaceae bacterium]